MDPRRFDERSPFNVDSRFCRPGSSFDRVAPFQLKRFLVNDRALPSPYRINQANARPRITFAAKSRQRATLRARSIKIVINAEAAGSIRGTKDNRTWIEVEADDSANPTILSKFEGVDRSEEVAVALPPRIIIPAVRERAREAKGFFSTGTRSLLRASLTGRRYNHISYRVPFVYRLPFVRPLLFRLHRLACLETAMKTTTMQPLITSKIYRDRFPRLCTFAGSIVITEPCAFPSDNVLLATKSIVAWTWHGRRVISPVADGCCKVDVKAMSRSRGTVH